ncbi:sulfite dehydrogenase [Methylicorpusculum sp.]|uniref:sulfite dehydrogenase n=2 Tax=Methylicorpusculum sp. TaxID=2713644 RepID=UPI00272F321D|nr:sulfite dehydrogenase [Methylicorpusculum sp.]MDP2177941.1 sulfite dehydrogenase [Methylicorpusculum sp.]MDP3528213.1 sulfite dehydrogenase [Methylicorpusculum sp.]
MHDELKPIAGGGLLDRRLFLKKGLTFSSIAWLAPSVMAEEVRSDAMTRPGRALSNYGKPSNYENKVIRWTMGNAAAPGNGVSWTPLHALEGMITPNGLHFERHHNGVPDIDPQYHHLLIHGLVNRALVFRIEDLLRYPMTSRYCFIECGGNSNAGWHSEPMQTEAGYFHGMASCSEWTGIPVKMLFNEAGIKGRAKWVIAEGADASMMNISLPLEKVLDDCLLAFYQNGERIRPENGYPVRLLVPGWEGVLNVKWLRRLRLTNRPVMARNETAKYTELLPNGMAEQFSFVMGVKSLITRPSYGQQLDNPGLYQITGLAWSGHGKIVKVEVSADGGKSWADAQLQEPVLSKCFTRFRIPWQWDGKKAVLKSRAIDDQGNQQPERYELIQAKGQQGYFHYHAIVSWAIADDGSVSHVYA